MDQVSFPKTPIDVTNILSGSPVKGSGKQLPVYSPYNGKQLGTLYCSNQSDLELAVEQAYSAFSGWAQTPLKERCAIGMKFRQLLLKNMESLANTVSIESGKTLSESRAGILKGVEVLDFATSLQNLDGGGQMEVSRGVTCTYKREPLGVVAGITPFNFPIMVPMWMIPIALTLGNAFVWKPSEKTPLASLALAELIQQAGYPQGIFQVVQGDSQAVNAIMENKLIKAVAFVGSTKVAKIVYSNAAQNFKRVLALGGAKNHIFLLPDADVEVAAQGIADSFTGCAGQRCMASSVLLAVGDVDSLIQAIIAKAKAKQLGKDMGAIITSEQVSFLEQSLQKVKEEGAQILLNGASATPPQGMDKGYWFGPTVIDQVKPGSFAHETELFGPLLSIIRCKTLSEALQIQRQNNYGNAASVFTTHGPSAFRVTQEAKAGMVGVNVGVPVPREPFSFGGINESKFGFGDITGPHVLNFWSDLKKITTKWGQQTDANWMS